MQVEYLADHRDRLQEVAELHHGEWPSPELGDSIEARERTLSTCCRRGEIPLGLIALDQNALVRNSVFVHGALRNVIWAAWLEGTRALLS
jgi:hypothetical protein